MGARCPKRGQDGPKTGSGWPKMGARCPKRGQDSPKMAPDRRERGSKPWFLLGFIDVRTLRLRWLRIAQDEFKIAQDRSKMGSRWPEIGPRWAQDGPKKGQGGPRCGEDSQDGMGQDRPRCALLFRFPFHAAQVTGSGPRERSERPLEVFAVSLRTLGKGGVGGNPAGRVKGGKAQRAADVSRRGPKPWKHGVFWYMFVHGAS